MDLGRRWDNLSCQDLDFCCKVDSTSGNIIFSLCSCLRLCDSFIYSSEEIGIDPISGIFLELSKYLVTTILFNLNKLKMYLILSGSFTLTSTRSTFSLYPSFVYIRDSPIWKDEVGYLVLVEYIQTF